MQCRMYVTTRLVWNIRQFYLTRFNSNGKMVIFLGSGVIKC